MYQSHTGRLTGLWFLPKPAFGLNTNDDDDDGRKAKEEGRIRMEGSGGIRCKQLVGNVKEARICWNLKVEALDRILWLWMKLIPCRNKGNSFTASFYSYQQLHRCTFRLIVRVISLYLCHSLQNMCRTDNINTHFHNALRLISSFLTLLCAS